MPEKYVLYGTLVWPISVIIPRLLLKGFMVHIFEVFYISLSSIKLFMQYLWKKPKFKFFNQEVYKIFLNFANKN